MCCTTKSQSSAGDGMDKVDSNLSLQFRAEKSHTDSLRHVCVELGGRAMTRELSFHPAQAIQASHRPSYGLELLKHGEHVGSAHSTVVDELYPKSLEDHTRGGSPPWQSSYSGCIAGGGTFCKLTCRPQLGCPAEAPDATGIVERRDTHWAGCGGCGPEVQTRNGLGIEGRDLLRNCNSFCDRERL